MGDKIKVDSEALKTVYQCLKLAAETAENAEEACASIRELSKNDWNTQAQKLFEQNAANLQTKCSQLKDDLTSHRNMIVSVLEACVWVDKKTAIDANLLDKSQVFSS